MPHVPTHAARRHRLPAGPQQPPPQAGRALTLFCRGLLGGLVGALIDAVTPGRPGSGERLH